MKTYKILFGCTEHVACNTISSRILCFLILNWCISVAFPTSSFSLEIFNRSPAAVQYGFDFMETFDDIRDWQGAARRGKGNYGIMSSDYPKRTDGSDTPFNVYDYWASTDPGDDFIKDHRVNGGFIWDPKHSGVGKSLCMDISHRGDNGLGNGKNWGPSRFGTYFGSIDGVTGDHTYGYEEMYVFFMAYIHPNQWPTELGANKLGIYVPGHEYLYGKSWKLMTMAHGFKAPWVHWQGPGSGHSPEYENAKGTYGWFPNVVHFKPHHPEEQYPEIMYDDRKDYIVVRDGVHPPCESEHREIVRGTYPNVTTPVGQWVGFEIRYTLNSRGQDDGSMQVWWYESNGTAHAVQERTKQWLQSICLFDAGDKMNVFFIGGNNSSSYNWGPTMEPRYYIDDLIIDSDRIGPRYFSLFTQEEAPEIRSISNKTVAD